MSNNLIKDAVKKRISSMSYELTVKLYDYITSKLNANKEDINRVIKRFEESLLLMIEKSIENEILLDEIDGVLSFDNPNLNSLFMKMMEDLKSLGIEVPANDDIKNIVSDALKDTKVKTIEDVKKVMPTLDNNAPATNREMESSVKDEKIELSAANLPWEIEEDFRRIFNYSGYDVVREGDYFYAVERLSKKQEKIVFYSNFHQCFLESNPENKVFINIALNDSSQDYGSECVSMINGVEVYFHEERRDLMVKDTKNDLSYHISINSDNELVIIKSHDNELVADSYENLIDEIERLMPGVLAQFMKDYGVRFIDKDKLSAGESNRESALNEREKDIENIDDLNRKEFLDALETQKGKDIEDVRMKIERNSGLSLDKEVA